jgi:polysaccharide biosynthesis/export protein
MKTANLRSTITLGVLSALAAFLVGCASTKNEPTDDFSQVSSQQAAPSNAVGIQAATNSQPAVSSLLSSQRPESIILREGDTVRITFPGSPNLNTIQQIRRDGKISLPMVGEVKAIGITPVDLEKQLVDLYAPQLVTKEVNVTVESSAYFVFITGAVGRPGHMTFDRPITALEALIDAGVDYTKANMKDVTVIRRQGGREERHHLNLKKELQRGGGEPFFLQPMDIVYVRERFTWF